MHSAIKFRVSGKVQGVFFRASCKREAESLELQGWVRNCSNGDVEGEASGEEKQLGRFRSWLGKGPQLARVDALKIEDSPGLSHDGFVIR